ncbi:MAG: 4-hydroxy-tetrahydrodipicolinate reductase, partial [Paludibacteraceae bacterium]|nr:4-hydroxy-tetrahydrodipicolinate reductase [Paludibacteraceae bacterium]
MKIALIGYGKMGHIIERIALERGHEVVSRIDIDNQEDFESAAFRSADVAIEFTAPKVAMDNYRKAFAAGVSVVSGTTGWTERMPEVEALVKEKGLAFFWASNFSLGVNIFMAVNSYLARIMNGFADYDVSMAETHHIHKLDAPSGTAITLAEGILKELDRKSGWELGKKASAADKLPIEAIREGE